MLAYTLQMTAKMGERDSREEILKAFRLFDDDGSGTITLKVREILIGVCCFPYMWLLATSCLSFAGFAPRGQGAG